MVKKKIIKERTEMPCQDPVERTKNFSEVALGYTEEMSLKEAERCLHCKHRNCVKGCPVDVPIPEFIEKIEEHDFDGAFEVIYGKNVLPSICGRVCPQENQCEAMCTMGKIKGSRPVAIGRLERFVGDRARERARFCEEGDPEPYCMPEVEKKDKKVAVIGSGPAGVTCASELAKMGYDVTIFEAFHKAGGVLVYGIPEFRLPKEIVREEVEKLKEMDVQIEYNRVIGKILELEDLRDMGYEAFFLGIGAGVPIFLKIPGIELNGVLSANEFLTRVNLMEAYKFPETDTPVNVGNRIAVIGGGNVAMDSARTALRLGAEKVMVIYRRSEKELPARREEYEHAVEEGVEFHFLRNPVGIKGDKDEFVESIEVIKMKLGEPDESGRRRPLKIPDSEYEIPVDNVIMAIGTRANPLLPKNTKGLELNKWGYIKVNEDMRTSIPDVFAAGDIVTGGATVISAMGGGKRAAKQIDCFLNSN